MNPVNLAQEVEDRYRRYLETTFDFRDSILRDSFREELAGGPLCRGPYLEATPVFRRGKTANELIAQVLDKPPDQAFSAAMLGDRPLFGHQEQAIQKVFGQGGNVVVATGTGSGKTESFLYPILLHLYREHRAGQLQDGIRALILYPMNALASDQRERLGKISQLLQENGSAFRFTFGQYVGQTPENEHDQRRGAHGAIDRRLPGELVLRREMRERPPHILLTNYSMLEYLLIRPSDSPLFDNGAATWWTFLVLDEAHQYRGTKGIEMGMLLRRLKERLRKGGRSGSIQCLATSATIAGGERDKATVAQFATVLFGETFHEDDVVLGETEPIWAAGNQSLPFHSYLELHEGLDRASSDSLAPIAQQVGLLETDVPAGARGLGAILRRDLRSELLIRTLSTGPQPVAELANEVFADAPQDRRLKYLEILTELLTRAEDPVSGSPLLSARYHLFLRSLEGAFLTYMPRKRILLARGAGTDDVATFELALCRECGQHYLVGKIDGSKFREAIRDPGAAGFGATFLRPIEDDEKQSDGKNDSSNQRRYRLCTRCSTVSHDPHSQPTCGHASSILVEQQEQAQEKEDQIPRCSACEYQAPDPVREVVHGTDGPHAVVATTLYQRLPEERRKVLAFADSRQEAAFFAWYLERSYEDILNRNLILKAVERLVQPKQHGATLEEMAYELRNLYLEHKMFPPSKGDIDLLRSAWITLYREFLTDEPRISLEGVGLVRWQMKWPEHLGIPHTLLDSPWLLDLDEARRLVCLLIESMRSDKAVDLQTPPPVKLVWADLNLVSKQARVRIGPPRNEKDVRSWDGEQGKRAQFLKKILLRKGLSEVDALKTAANTLREIWEGVCRCDDEAAAWDRVLRPVRDARIVNPGWWRLVLTSDEEAFYQCDRCSRIQSSPVSEVCVRHRCQGTVLRRSCKDQGPNHYRLLYEDYLPVRLRCEEHTAQIENDKARAFQADFKRGDIHLLSSSTTFELGVDLGDLDTIFLRNVPPEAFNYAQRVGRAGRRAGFPGFAVTFCRRSPHDLYHFAEPDSRILKGSIRPPRLRLSNDKIILRHLTAVTLSYFFQDSPKRFGSVRSFLGDMERPTATEDVARFVAENRKLLESSFRAIVQAEMVDLVGLSDGSWGDRITSQNSRLGLAEAEVASDFRSAVRIKNDSVKKEDYSTAGWAKRRATTISEEDTLSFLSRKAVIPKYGFPVDVVQLDTHRDQQISESLEVVLQRDLSLAIAEFAPTSKLVANKKEWVSYGLKRVPERELPRREYLRCLKHNVFTSWNHGESPTAAPCCTSCFRATYVVPQFGFVTNRDRPSEPSVRPPRAFTTRPFFIDLVDETGGELNLGPICLVRASPGRMLVLCEGRRGSGFYVCDSCGAGFHDRRAKHKTAFGQPCSGKLQCVSLGHELITDVIQLHFRHPLPPTCGGEVSGFSYSLAYAVLQGCADTLEIPATDLSATVAHQGGGTIPPVILYDNVPGGAGLVAQLDDAAMLKSCIEGALDRVSGQCGCGEDASCYGCLRNYRNQFAHQNLKRGPVRDYLKSILECWLD